MLKIDMTLWHGPPEAVEVITSPLLTSPSIWPLAERGALNDFCLDLTARAADGKIDPVIGREKEVQRVIQILGRRTKNNPILLGEPGVGKTAIAEGLAIAIVGNEVPDFLQVRCGSDIPGGDRV